MDTINTECRDPISVHANTASFCIHPYNILLYIISGHCWVMAQ